MDFETQSVVGQKRTAENDQLQCAVDATKEEEEVDLLAMLVSSSSSRLNMKDLPAAGKRGKVNFHGYMDEYFKERPPVPVSNIVFDNQTLAVVRDLTGSY